MSGEKKGLVAKGKEAVQKARQTVRKIINTIKFFATPLGTIVAWLLFIIFGILLLVVVVEVAAEAFLSWLGINTDYETFDSDLQVINDLYASGYASQIDPENFVNFKAFEYAVLIDAAEYIRTQGQEDFDLIENQGIYTKERDIYINQMGRDKYNEARGIGEKPTDPAVKLLTVSSTYNQGQIDDEILKKIMDVAISKETRNIDVVEAAASGEDKFETDGGETKGGNNRVSGPFLVYEFVYSETTASGDATYGTAYVSTETSSKQGEGTENLTTDTNTDVDVIVDTDTDVDAVTDTTTDANSNEESTAQVSSEDKISYNEEQATAKQLFTSGELGGSVVPYIYVIREEIDYDFYFDKDNNPIEIPFLLNAFNSELKVSTERSKEINRATGGLPVKVWPDQNTDKVSGDYTWVPYYSDETNCTIYKIPLRTLIGRYMPRTELLHAWTILKQDITQNISSEQDEQNEKKLEIINNVTEKIKQIYSEACLEGETTEPGDVKGTIEELDDDNKIVEKEVTYNYLYDNSNKNSFVEFEKAGIETTRYLDLKNEEESQEISYVSDFVSALLVSGDFQIECKHTVTTTVDLDNKVSKNKGSSSPTMNTRDDNGTPTTATYTNELTTIRTMHISDLKINGLEEKSYIPAVGTPEDGYTPPSNLHNLETGYLYAGNKDDIEKLNQKILDAACKKLKIEGDETTEITDAKITGLQITYCPIFITEEIETSQVLEIEHRRMPVLLVKSATTWARQINYTHHITQNMFEPTDVSYLVPKCVSSMGIQSFTTEENTGAYRGKAYEEIFYYLQEKDVVSMLLTLETFADEGIDDCYEYMRELYKLVMAAQSYSNGSLINPGTYTYMYLQNSILYYDDKQTQAIYWQQLLGQRGSIDALTKDEVENVRTRDPVIKWQILEYDKYEECDGMVYALNPYGSAYVRAYQQAAKSQTPDNPDINGAYEPGSHEGADLCGRSRIDSILQEGNSATDTYSDNISQKIYNYGLKQYEAVYAQKVAKNNFLNELEEELSYMPIVAVAPGKVTAVGFDGRSGFFVKIEHDNEGTYTLYCHLKRWPNVAVGDYVGAGTVIGYEGNTGRSGGTHLHFEIHKPNATAEERGESVTGTVDPQYYIFPTFNPFYYQEKIEEGELSLASEYMTLYRTVYMADIEGESVGMGELKRTVPDRALLESTSNLIAEQGKKESTLYMTGDLDWAESTYDDIRARTAFFDVNLATEAGLFDMDVELMNALYGYIPVKTDMAGGLPALTREELEYILENWLSSKYSQDEFNSLMENVFTEETIEKILIAQEEYQVSAVFALAVGAYKEWEGYDGTGGEFTDFVEEIAGDNYFGEGKFTIAAIGTTYDKEGDPPGAAWSSQVTAMALQIMQYYTGDKWSSNLLGVDNSEFLSIARNFIMALANQGYTYGSNSGINFDPYTNTITSGKSCIDCTAYVSGVIRAYAKVHNIDALKSFNKGSSSFCDFAKDVANEKGGAAKYFDVVWIRNNQDPEHPDGSNPTLAELQRDMLPGDILIFYAGKSFRS